MTEVEHQTLAEIVEWCDGLLTHREATRLRRLAERCGEPGDGTGDQDEIARGR